MISKPLHFLKKSLAYSVCLTAITALSSSAIAAVNQYSFTQLSSIYTPLSNPVNIATATSNSTILQSLYQRTDSLTFPNGFVFNYNSSDQTKCFITTNGYIYFGSNTALTTSPLGSSATSMTGVISVWGRNENGVYNVNGITSSINYQLTGDAPNRTLTIEYNDMRPNFTGSITSVYTLSYQILLHETTNVIELMYDQGSDKAGTLTTNSSMQAGLRGATSNDFNVRTNTASTAFTNSSAATSASATQSYTPGTTTPGMPSSGLTYRFTPPAPLPVILQNFTGINNGNTNTLSWITGYEEKFNRFELEKSADGIDFQPITSIIKNAAAGGHYSFTDAQPYNGQNLYRLKMIDQNGSFTYSKIVALDALVNSNVVSVFPNPANDYVMIQSAVAAPAFVTLTDVTGKVVRNYKMNSNNLRINLSDLSKGWYIIGYQTTQTLQTIKVVKQ